MSHVRKQVRDHVANLIKGTVLCADRVEATRAKPVARDSGSAAYVYTTGESVQTLDDDETQMRTIRLRIDAFSKGDSSDLQDTLDAFAVEVEMKIAADARLGGLAAAAVGLRQSDFNANFDANTPFCVLSLVYDVQVLTVAGAPETAL